MEVEPAVQADLEEELQVRCRRRRLSSGAAAAADVAVLPAGDFRGGGGWLRGVDLGRQPVGRRRVNEYLFTRVYGCRARVYGSSVRYGVCTHPASGKE